MAAVLVPAFAASAHAQTPDIVLSNNSLHVKDGNWYLLEADSCFDCYTVKLATQPTAKVTVTIQEVDQNGTPVGDPNELLTGGVIIELVPSNPNPGRTFLWSTGYTVALASCEEERSAYPACRSGTGNSTDETVRIKHSASSSDANYNGKAKTQIVTEVDNDRVAVLTPTRVTVPEGSTASYKVKLKSQPTGNVTVTVARKSGGDTNLTVDTDPNTTGNQNTLTFTTTDWSTDQTVTLQAAEDNDNAHGSAVFTHTASGADYTEPGATLLAATLTAVENDNEVGLKLSSRSVSVPEKLNANDTTSLATYTVALNTQPTGDVTVTVTRESGNQHDTDLTVDTDPNTTGNQDTLTFTTTDWSTAQTVTLRAAVDADDAHGSAVFTHTASGGGHDAVSATLTATEVDKRAVKLSATPHRIDNDIPVSEGGTTSYKVWLGDKPSADVTVTVARKSGGDTDLTVDTDPDTTGNQNTLTFTSTNYSTQQTVTLSAAEDDDYYGGKATFAHTVSGAWTGTHEDITAIESDNDFDKTEPKLPPLPTKPHTFIFLPSPLPVTWIPEDGTKSLPVTLAARPETTVSVTVSKLWFTPNHPTPPDPDLTVAPGTLTFTSANWNVPQTVTLSAAEECDSAAPPPCTDDVDDGSAVVQFDANGDSGSYSGNVKLWVYEADNDNTSRALILSPTSVTVPEGSTASYTVRLASQPNESVTVTVARKSDDADNEHDKDLTVQTGESLTFTTDNWSTAKTVTLSAADDEDNVNGTAVFTHTPDGAWIIASKELTATEADNDRTPPAPPPPPPPSLMLSASRVTVPESWTATYTVALDTLPTADVTVTVASNDTRAVTVEPKTLTFTTSNYSSAQTVTVTAVVDADDEDERVSLSHEAVGGGYSASATVTVLVNDRTPLTFGDQTIPDQTYVHRTATAALTLPTAMGSKESLRYALVPALPAGLTFDPGTRVLAGTPTEVQAATRYTYTATDVDGVTATLTFTITVTADVEPTFDDPLITGPPIPDQTYVHQTATAAWTLPEATGGNGSMRYALAPALPAGLTFDPGTRVLAGTPTEVQAATRYTYTATDVDDDVATVTFTITVEADVVPTFEDPLITGPLIPDQTYVYQTAIAALTLPEATGGNPPLTYTLAASELAPAGTRSVPFKTTAGSGDPSTLPAGLTFDPVTRVLAGTPTELQGTTRYTYTATDVNGDAATVTFTITVEADVVPGFGDRPIANQTYLQQEAIRALTLPAATGGNGDLTYALAPTLPAGLTFDPATRVLAGTPTEVQAATRYTYTATDKNGDRTTLTFSMTVHAAANKAMLKVGLAAQGRALLSGATSVIGERFRSPGASSWAGVAAVCTGATPEPAKWGGRGSERDPEPAGSAPHKAEDCATGVLATVTEAVLGMSGGMGGTAGADSLGVADADDTRPRGPRAVNVGVQPEWNWESLVWGRSFAVPLKNAEGAGSAWTLWGAGDVQGFQGSPGQGRYDGQVRSLYLGIDTQWQAQWMAGAALAQSWGETEHTAGGSTGQLETTLTSIYPYVRGTLATGLEVWGIGGYGRGEADITLAPAGAATGATDTRDLSLAMGATGARQPMTEWGGLQLAVVGGAGYLSLVTDDGESVVADLDVAVQRARLAVEAMGTYGRLAPYVQVGGRYDGGDGQTGAGLETVAGLRYTSERLEFEARGRWLATHAADGYEEYGGLARLAVKPLADGTGFQLNVAPSWGAADGGARLLGGGAALLDGGAMPGMGVSGVPSATPRSLSLESELGYGFAVLEGQGVLTPYGGFALMGEETRQYRLGGRLGVAQWLTLNLEGSRQEGAGQQPADQGVQLTLDGRF